MCSSRLNNKDKYPCSAFKCLQFPLVGLQLKKAKYNMYVIIASQNGITSASQDQTQAKARVSFESVSAKPSEA